MTTSLLKIAERLKGNMDITILKDGLIFNPSSKFHYKIGIIVSGLIMILMLLSGIVILFSKPLYGIPMIILAIYVLFHIFSGVVIDIKGGKITKGIAGILSTKILFDDVSTICHCINEGYFYISIIDTKNNKIDLGTISGIENIIDYIFAVNLIFQENPDSNTLNIEFEKNYPSHVLKVTEDYYTQNFASLEKKLSDFEMAKIKETILLLHKISKNNINK